MPVQDQSLRELLTAIASREPAPGAGAAAGIALALGLVCARKAAAIMLKHGSEFEGLDGNDARLAELAEAALEAAERDAETFSAALAHEPGAERALVSEGEAFLELIEEARTTVARVSGRIGANVQGDVLAAQALIGAAETIARSNLAENAG